MAGYSMLPTLETPTSTVTFRLTGNEKTERDAWMRGAYSHGLSISEIAKEVGLTIPSVRNILGVKKRRYAKRNVPSRYSNLHPELRDFWLNEAHSECRDGMACMTCVGTANVIESGLIVIGEIN